MYLQTSTVRIHTCLFRNFQKLFMLSYTKNSILAAEMCGYSKIPPYSFEQYTTVGQADKLYIGTLSIQDDITMASRWLLFTTLMMTSFVFSLCCYISK